MEEMTLDAAFEKMIQTRGIYKKLNVDQGTVGNLRTYLKTADPKNGKHGVSDRRKRELLVLAGWKLKQEERWERE